MARKRTLVSKRYLLICNEIIINKNKLIYYYEKFEIQIIRQNNLWFISKSWNSNNIITPSIFQIKKIYGCEIC